MGTLTAGIKEIFSSAKTTGTNVMLCGNDGTPDGHMTMDNLANVLGVLRVTSISVAQQTTVGNGFYIVQGSSSSTIESNDGIFLKINGKGVKFTTYQEYKIGILVDGTWHTVI